LKEVGENVHREEIRNIINKSVYYLVDIKVERFFFFLVDSSFFMVLFGKTLNVIEYIMGGNGSVFLFESFSVFDNGFN
jgi:hypothetical protein